MSQIVVTTGKRFCDIDGLACVLAYQEITTPPALGIITSPLNKSIPLSVRKWLPDYPQKLTPGDYDFVITDVSEKDQFPAFVEPTRIIEIYDHHFGFEKSWQERLGAKAKIEAVGACATLIWEEFKARNVSSRITPLAANLLLTAIISNTLNFQANITTGRDLQAFKELKNYTTVPEDWIIRYFEEQEVDIYTNPQLTITSDTKIENIKGMECAIGQLEMWDSRNFIQENLNNIELALKSFNTKIWFLISPSISEGRTYIFTRSETIKDRLREVMAIDFFGSDIGITQRLWLRKEILQKIQ